MSLVPFLAITFGAAAAAFVVRHLPRLSLAIGLLGLLAATGAGLTIVPGDNLAIAGVRGIQTTEFGRLFVVLGCATGLLTVLIGLATAWQPSLPAALLAGFGALGLGLAIGDPIVAVLVVVAGALVGSMVTLARPITDRAIGVAARELRAIAVAGALALLGMAWIPRPLGPRTLPPEMFGLAFLLVAVAVSLRFGALPFHRWAARLAATAPEIALPLLLVWAPAAFAVVALAWMDRSIAPFLVPLDVERGIVVAIGAASIMLGGAAAWLQDDLEHVVGYSIVQDSGFVILGLAILDTSAWQPTRTWLLVFVLVKTAFAAWAAAVRVRFGTRQIPELAGWARRSPLLGAGLALIAVSTIGVPGLLAWDVRDSLIRLTLGSGLMHALVALGGLLSLTYYLRLALVGRKPASALVRAAPGDAPARRGHERPTAEESPAVPGGGYEELAGRQPRESTRSLARAEAVVARTWQANRAPIAATGVLLLSLIAVAAGTGWLDLGSAATAAAPELPTPGGAPSDSGGGPSFQPIGTP